MLDQLTIQQQKSLIELLIYVASADGETDDIEEAVLREYEDLIDVEPDSIDRDANPEDLLGDFDTPVSKFALLQELCRLAHLDGTFDDDEQAVVLEIAERLEVPLHLVMKIDAWVIDGLKWSMRGEALVDEAEQLLSS